MQMRLRGRASLAVVALLVLGGPLAASAQTSPAPATASGAMSSMADVSCDKAGPMMMGSMQPASMSQSAMPASNDVDKAYSMMMAAHAKAMMDMAKVEMRCGKDKKVKDNAARTSPDLTKLVQTLTIF